jgi:tol-pal system protein YbgF
MLGLARADAEGLRAQVSDLETEARARITRIGAERARPPQQEESETEAEPTPGRRPVLRLYGPARTENVPIPGPIAPPFADAPPLPSIRLPVVLPPGGDPEEGVPAIPQVPVIVAPSAPEPILETPSPRRAPGDDAGSRAYRAALAHLSARRFDQALSGLDAFMRDNPRHAYADNALYWRGEIHYAQRDYRRAVSEFTALIERYPRGNKVPEAMLRIGLCHEHMGDRARARAMFERLRTMYPESVAARMASREDV